MTDITESQTQKTDWLTAYEAADLLRLSWRTLAKWRCLGTGKLPYSKLRGRVFYKRSDCEQWRESNMVSFG